MPMFQAFAHEVNINTRGKDLRGDKAMPIKPPIRDII